MKTCIVRQAHAQEDIIGSNYIVTTVENLDEEMQYDEIFVIDESTTNWVSYPTITDIGDGKSSKVKNSSLRGLLSSMVLHTNANEYPHTYFIEKRNTL